jgi:hypothetical protein
LAHRPYHGLEDHTAYAPAGFLQQRQKDPDLTINVEIGALDQSIVDGLIEASLEDLLTDAEVFRAADPRNKILASALSRLDIGGNVGEADALLFVL